MHLDEILVLSEIRYYILEIVPTYNSKIIFFFCLIQFLHQKSLQTTAIELIRKNIRIMLNSFIVI